jgi:hypothetical protein
MSAIASLAPSPRGKLYRGDTISIDGDHRGVKLRCLSGQVWITQPGDFMDHLLAAGREFVITRSGRVVIQALTQEASLADSRVAR